MSWRDIASAILFGGTAPFPTSEEGNQMRCDPHRLVHDLADLLGMRLGERAAEDGEVLAEDEDEAPVDRAVAGDDSVARGPSARPCQNPPSGARRTCPILRRSLRRAEPRAARARSACPSCAAPRHAVPAAGLCRCPLLVEFLETALHWARPLRPCRPRSSALCRCNMLTRPRLGRRRQHRARRERV